MMNVFMQRTPRIHLARKAVAAMACFAAVWLAASAASAQAAPGAQTVTITLDDALRRALTSEPGYAAAIAESRSAGLDHAIARAGLLPDVTLHNQGLYTQPNGLQNQAGQGAASQPAPRFIANNAVREYASQGIVNETVGLAQVGEIRHADAAAARARAELEIARRGLTATVSGLYFGAVAADHKLEIASRAHAEAADFVALTTKRERGRESAHADVVKAQLEEQQRARDLSDAKLEAQKARLDLGVLLFTDPRTPYVLADQAAAAPPARAEVEQAAAANNPELKSALAAMSESNADVLSARAAYLPTLGVNYSYGIDAPQFAVNGPDHVKNLGYSAMLTVDIPVWDWLATEHKVKQSEIRRDAARVALTATQRRMIARLEEAYAEAEAARDQLTSLDSSVETAAESLRLVKLAYAGGESTVLEVVDAQRAYVGAENSREDGRVRYRAALADLETLTGSKVIP
jgi:outer membrane protein TolC